MAQGIELNQTAPRVAVGTAASGTPTTVDVTNTYAAITLDLATLASLISTNSMTNQVIQPVLLRFKDANNSCAAMRMIVLGTIPETDPG
jgi:hypothetical protein